jgi:hypothetical protein
MVDEEESGQEEDLAEDLGEAWRDCIACGVKLKKKLKRLKNNGLPRDYHVPYVTSNDL